MAQTDAANLRVQARKATAEAAMLRAVSCLIRFFVIVISVFLVRRTCLLCTCAHMCICDFYTQLLRKAEGEVVQARRERAAHMKREVQYIHIHTHRYPLSYTHPNTAYFIAVWMSTFASRLLVQTDTGPALENDSEQVSDEEEDRNSQELRGRWWCWWQWWRKGRRSRKSRSYSC